MADFLFSVESLANYFSGLKKSKTFSCCKTKIGFTFFNNENHIFLSLSLSLSLLIFGGIFFIRNIVDFIIQMDDLWMIQGVKLSIWMFYEIKLNSFIL